MRYVIAIVFSLILSGCAGTLHSGENYLIYPTGKSYDIENSYEVLNGIACPRGKSYEINRCFSIK